MRTDDMSALTELAGLAAAGGVQRIAQAHLGVSERVFGSIRLGVGPVAEPVRMVHDSVASATYATVHRTLAVGSRVAATGLSLFRASTPDAPRLADTVGGRVALGVLNGFHGDALVQHLPSLAIAMTARRHGHDLELTRAGLASAYPSATHRVVVFLHGLVETDDAWQVRARGEASDVRSSFGSLLEADLGFCAVWLRYNSGQRISANGADLSQLLEQLVECWPVPVTELVLIGHSMGGLVIRSALAQAARGPANQGLRWPAVVSSTVSLGTPHAGAPLEQGVHRVSGGLRRLPETRWLADQLDARSAGIKDLRYGDLLSVDGQHVDESAQHRGRAPIPLHPTAQHFAVLATVSSKEDGVAARLLGDLLVRPDSAVGNSGTEDRLAYSEECVVRLTGLHHFDLLNHPLVYRAIRSWLE